MTAPDLTKLTAKELHDTLSTGLTSWTPPLYAVMREFVRRAEGYALACGDRDSARDELAEMKALRDAAKSDHKEACRILRNYQTLAEERGREINALIRERDELHRRAQANALVQAERDEFDEELHSCRAIVGATSEHLHVDLEELVDKLRRTEADSRSWQELATARAQAIDALRSHAETVRMERESRNRGGADDCFTDNARSRQRESEAIESILGLLAAAPAAQPTPAAPVTDAEIEAAIDDLCEASYDFEASGCDPKSEAARVERDKQHALVALIARRIAGAAAPVDPWTPSQCDYDRSIHNNPDANAWADFFVQVHPGLTDKHDVMRGWFASAMMAMHDSPRCKPAPVDSEREAAIEAWRKRATPRKSVHITEGEEFRALVDEAVRLMRSAPPAPAGDQDAKLRELRAWIVSRSDVPGSRGIVYSTVTREHLAEIDRLLAAIAAAPEAP